jgi:hypothetical protein
VKFKPPMTEDRNPTRLPRKKTAGDHDRTFRFYWKEIERRAREGGRPRLRDW